ncbi:hypothetical protein DL95DRAFT_315944, partial [Leptodontidium sp. 2 PMI_412]
SSAIRALQKSTKCFIVRYFKSKCSLVFANLFTNLKKCVILQLFIISNYLSQG